MSSSHRSASRTTEGRPLSRRVVVVTRPRPQAAALARPLEALGATPLLIPAFRTCAVESPAFAEALREALQRVDRTLVVFTSANAVDRFSSLCAAEGVDPASFAAAGVAAVGPATARAATAIGLPSSVVPTVNTAAGLVEALAVSGLPLGDMHALYPRARDAAGAIEEGLTPLVSSIESHVVYGVEPESPAPAFQAPPDVVTFASSSAATYFLRVVTPEDAATARDRIPVACIGPSTAHTAREAGYRNVVEATTHTLPGLVEAVAALFTSKG